MDHNSFSALYTLGPEIGSGYHGCVFLGTHNVSGEKVAIKAEMVNDKSSLPWEFDMFTLVQGGTGIPKLLQFGTESDTYVMVMELMGHSLSELFEKCSSKFSLKTVLMLADQLISRLEFIHSRHIIHRDIKGENLVMGLNEKKNQVHVIDFGFAMKHIDDETGKHIPYQRRVKFVGNLAFSSMSTSRGIQQSRRDDLEALGYLLLQFLRKLPWVTKYENITNGENLQELVLRMKLKMPLKELCAGYPEEFYEYLLYCRGLRFAETPDYDYLRYIFSELFDRKGFVFDYKYDWDNLDNNDA